MTDPEATVPGDRPLSEHFSLHEFLKSDTAARLGLENIPDAAQLANLHQNAENMEAVRDVLGGVAIHVSSGLRVLLLNRAIGSKDSSAHVDGRATDFEAPAFGSPLKICRAIAASGIQFDQLIWEHTWVHIGWARAGETPRLQVLTLMPGGTYAYGIVDKAAA